MGVAASSCSSSSKKYEVFLSFRGEDTRGSFTSHLYAALCRSGIETYIDDDIPKGDDISQSLIQAIENSSISVVIFSKNYASSKWCLNELIEILRCKQRQKQHVVPIFYQVDPSHVRNQSGAYEEAFAQHSKNNPGKVRQWRQALSEIASLGGWDSRVFWREAELIQNIVNDIMQKLNQGSSSAVANIVGIDENSNHIESLMKFFSKFGIWGKGGIGKTTMAKVVFAKLHSQFDSCYFIENLREESEKYGLKYVRDKLFYELSKGTTPRRLYYKKVFIVLDDVSNTNQLDYLQNEVPSLRSGSKVIIISRDRHVLNGRVDKIHEATALRYYSSLQLFNLKAFHKYDCESEYKKLADKAIAYAQGNPLALTTLGSFLYSKTVKEWESALRKLEMTANQDIQAVLKLSYDGLDDEEREIFLDIAFFLKGESTRYIMATLESCGFHASICLRTLMDKGLISIGYVVHMHDLIQSMAFEIVRQECVKSPGERSRLQKYDEVCYVLKNNQGSDAIQGMSFDWSRLVSFSNPLRHLQLDKFSSKSQPLSFYAEKLVELNMHNSDVTRLWDGEQNLVNLRKINLAGSKQLKDLPSFYRAQNLKWVNLEGCEGLRYPSIISLPCSGVVKLRYCRDLKSLKAESQSQSLSRLHVFGFNSLKEFPNRITYLSLEETSVEILGFSIGQMKKLQEPSPNGLTLKNLPVNEICCMRSLQELCLYDCGEIIDKSKLHTLFDALLSLKSICLRRTSKLTELPNNIKHLSRLQSLDVSYCQDLQSLPELPPSIEAVTADNCISLETVRISITSAPQLKFLFLPNCLKLENRSLSRVMEWAYFSLKQSAHTKQTVFVCCPGSKAPEWFTLSQETKASNYITTELPPSTNDLVGVIFCSVISLFSYGYYGEQCECFEFDMMVKNLDSHHVFLWCDPYPMEDTNYMSSVSFLFPTVRDVDGVIGAFRVCPIYSSEYREFLQEMELKLESVTRKERHRNIDDEQQQSTPTKKWKKPSMLSSKSKTTHDLDELIFSLSQLNLECMKDSILQI